MNHHFCLKLEAFQRARPFQTKDHTIRAIIRNGLICVRLAKALIESGVIMQLSYFTSNKCELSE